MFRAGSIVKYIDRHDIYGVVSISNSRQIVIRYFHAHRDYIVHENIHYSEEDFPACYGNWCLMEL